MAIYKNSHRSLLALYNKLISTAQFSHNFVSVHTRSILVYFFLCLLICPKFIWPHESYTIKSRWMLKLLWLSCLFTHSYGDQHERNNVFNQPLCYLLILFHFLGIDFVVYILTFVYASRVVTYSCDLKDSTVQWHFLLNLEPRRYQLATTMSWTKSCWTKSCWFKPYDSPKELTS